MNDIMSEMFNVLHNVKHAIRYMDKQFTIFIQLYRMILHLFFKEITPLIFGTRLTMYYLKKRECLANIQMIFVIHLTQIFQRLSG